MRAVIYRGVNNLRLETVPVTASAPTNCSSSGYNCEIAVFAAFNNVFLVSQKWKRNL